MYQVLYRKWRPQVFADVAGQPHVTTTLTNELKAGRLAHAYLFTGSRGTGKTTCAKILAKAVNCLHPVNGDPCNECEICKGIDNGSILDVVEIDAASNNGVDNIRDLREEANFTPVNAKYRVYIIDEVHMLSIGAFNALLKTLEEPPDHVIFILATTEVHKLPATILSRCQRFDFRRIPPEDIAARLDYVSKQEGFELSGDAALLIARLADGALRDALSILDQCAGISEKITADVVGSAAGLTGRDYLFELSDAVSEKNSASALEILDRLHKNSCDMERLCTELINHFRNFMIVKTVKNSKELIVCTAEELDRIKKEAVRFSLEEVLYALDLLQETLESMHNGTNLRIEMEMTLVKLCTPTLETTNEALLRRVSALETALKTGTVLKIKEDNNQKEEAVPPANNEVTKEEKEEKSSEPAVRQQKTEKAVPGENVAAAKINDEVFPQWPQVLETLSELDVTLIGVASDSHAYVRGDHILIESSNPIFDDFIHQSSHANAIIEAIYRVTGKKYRIGIYKKPTDRNKTNSDPLSQLVARAKNAGVEIKSE